MGLVNEKGLSWVEALRHSCFAASGGVATVVQQCPSGRRSSLDARLLAGTPCPRHVRRDP